MTFPIYNAGGVTRVRVFMLNIIQYELFFPFLFLVFVIMTSEC